MIGMLETALKADRLLSAATQAAQTPYTMITINSGDVGWLIAASTLVLLMTIPGLALFYGGLVRSQSFLSVILQCAAIVAVASLAWILVGYTLAFGPPSSQGWLGGGRALLLSNLAPTRPGTAVPESAFVLFQMTLAIIAPALIVGAWAERARFGWTLGFAGLWVLMVYAPIAHWIWGGGWLARQFGTLDFAGGLVVHSSAGVSALVVALLLGPRKGFPDTTRRPHAPALAMTGAALLWVGWFGLSGGAAFGANGNAVNAVLNTHIAACVGALVWMLTEHLNLGKPTGIGWATGAIAGLATITPAAVFISPGAAMVFGGLSALICYGVIQRLKYRWHIDDTLDVFAVHGVGGMIGAMLLAVFLSPSLGGTGYYGDATMESQLVAQAVGVGAVLVWSAVGSAIIALMVSVVLPMRVSEEDEDAGIDQSSHGQTAWRLEDR